MDQYYINGLSKKYIFWGNQKLMLISYNILFTQSLFSENTIHDYVYVSKVKMSVKLTWQQIEKQNILILYRGECS